MTVKVVFKRFELGHFRLGIAFFGKPVCVCVLDTLNNGVRMNDILIYSISIRYRLITCHTEYI